MKFDHILADPDWWYNKRLNEQHGGNRTKFGDGVWFKYATPPSDLRSICRMPVKSLTTGGSILHLWTTGPHIMDARLVMKKWGFSYVTIEFVWVKISKQFIEECLRNLQSVLRRLLTQHESLYDVLVDGTRKLPGNWTASNVEVVLIGRQEHSARAEDVHMFPQLIFTPLPRVPHEKPSRVHEYIDLSWPSARKIELYARKQWMSSGQREWVCLGNEVPGQEGMDMRESIPAVVEMDDGEDWATALERMKG